MFLLGKGGVGRSTLAAALGLLAARRGRRAIVVEVSGRGDVPRLFGRTCEAGVETELAPGLWTLDVDPRQALEEYLRDQLPLRVIADAIGSSATFGYVAAATPGLRELLTIGKIWELAQPQRRARGAQPYDVVVVDAPATGHGLALLEAPRSFANAAQVGPIARQGRRIAVTLRDRSMTALVAVATPNRPPSTSCSSCARRSAASSTRCLPMRSRRLASRRATRRHCARRPREQGSRPRRATHSRSRLPRRPWLVRSGFSSRVSVRPSSCRGSPRGSSR